MADLLYPPRRMGSAVVTLGYAMRDSRGVEPPDAAPADRTGFNEEADWTDRGAAAQDLEHGAGGEHLGPKMPFACISLNENLGDGFYIGWWSWRGHELQDAKPFVEILGWTLTTVDLRLLADPPGQHLVAELYAPGFVVNFERLLGLDFRITSRRNNTYAEPTIQEWAHPTVIRLFSW